MLPAKPSPTNLQNVPGYGNYHPPATPPQQTEDVRAIYWLPNPYEDPRASVGEVAEYLDWLRKVEGSCI